MIAYCDYIATVIRKSLLNTENDSSNLIGGVREIKWDLHHKDGYMVSTKKTLDVVNMNSKWYRITVEEL